MSEDRVSNWNIPNALTTLRIVMVPFFGWALLTHGGHEPLWRWVAAAIFIVAMITDKIDGDLARKHGLITNYGKIADPIADKAITGMAFIGLSMIGHLWWWVTIVVLVREWAVTIARLSIAKHVVMSAQTLGKVKTTLQAIALSGFILPLVHFTGAWAGVGMVLWWIAAVMMAAAVALTVWSGLDFARDAVVQTRAARANRRTVEPTQAG